MQPTGIDRPVDIARILLKTGLSLSEAHQILDRLAAGDRVEVPVDQRQFVSLRIELRGLGILLRPTSVPDEA